MSELTTPAMAAEAVPAAVAPPPAQPLLTPTKTAVIVLHGVADQKRGETVQAIVNLLLAESDNSAQAMRYQSVAEDDVTITVAPLSAKLKAPAHGKLGSGQPPADTSLDKAFRQSWTSDYRRPALTHEGKAGQSAQPLGSEGDSEGVAFTDYLLDKACKEQTPATTYTLRKIRAVRRDQGVAAPAASPQSVDFFEMYWADLSRLAGSVPRIVTEIFTLLFRLSTLGRDTVQHMFDVVLHESGKAHAKTKWWQRLHFFQSTLDWLYSRWLALLYLQLIVVALLLMPFGWMHQGEPKHLLEVALLGIVLSVATLVVGFRYRLFAALACAALGVALIAWLAQQTQAVALSRVVVLLWLLLIAVLYEWWLRTCEERFPLVHFIGRILGVLAMLAFALNFDFNMDEKPDAIYAAGVVAALRYFEFALLAIEFLWGLLAILLIAWFVCGVVASRCHGAGCRERSAVTTGQFGVVVSLGCFLVVAMLGWALLSSVTETAARGVDYTPLIYRAKPATQDAIAFVRAAEVCQDHSQAACAAAPESCLATKIPSVADRCTSVANPPFALSARCSECFLHDRFVHSVETFAVISLLLACFFGYLIATLAPSVLAETRFAKPDSLRLGRWLTHGFGAIERVLLLFTGVGSVMLLLVVLLLSEAMLHRYLPQLPTPLTDVVMGLMKENDISWGAQSQAMLKPFVIAAGTVFAAFTAIGGVLSRYLPGLRAPLDAALDVDNHFREFPRKAIPRARIFARYVALIDHLREQGYTRIVIAAHSQGTVISADLLRYLLSRRTPGGSATATDAPITRRVGDYLRDIGDVRLLTYGCPLRQLYAERFPTRYDWIVRAHGTADGSVSGPTVHDVGVQRWFNAYTSGDYVGRWLWTPNADAIPAPTTDAICIGKCGDQADGLNVRVIRDWVATKPQHEICIGSGAHTHYLDAPGKRDADAQAAAMAGLIDAMIALP